MNTLNTEYENNFALAGDMMGKYTQANIDAWKFLVDSQIGFGDLWVEYFRENLERLTAVKNQEEVFTVQSELLTEYSGKFSDQIQQVFNTLSETQSEFLNELFKENGLPSFSIVGPEKKASGKSTRKRTNSKAVTGKSRSKAVNATV